MRSFEQIVESRLREEEELEPGVRHYEVTRRGVCHCNFDPHYQCGSEGQSMFSWEISAHVHSLDSNSFAIDNVEILDIANQYDTDEKWRTDSCEAVCNGWISALINRCKELGYDLISARALISPNQFVDVVSVWNKGDVSPTPIPTRVTS